jgi:predicted dehydrogenase
MVDAERGVGTRVAIAGLGKMGLMHSAVVSALPQAQVVAVIDQQPQLAQYARSLGLEAPFYTSVEQALAGGGVDAVFVCTPAAAHLPTARACVEKGVHVFVEKPLADTLENARRMYDLVKDGGVVHAVGYMKRHYPLYRKMRELVQGGILGRVHQCHCSLYLSQVFRPPKGWIYDKGQSGGGIVINSTSHLLSLLHGFFGDVTGVFARARSVHSAVEDVAIIVLEFANGVVASVDTSWAVAGHSVEYTQILMVGEKGSLEIADDRARLFLSRDEGGYRQGWTSFHRSEFDTAPVDLSAEYGGEGYCNEDLDFLHCCASGGTPLVSWREGVAVQQIVDAIYESAGGGYVRL